MESNLTESDEVAFINTELSESFQEPLISSQKVINKNPNFHKVVSKCNNVIDSNVESISTESVFICNEKSLARNKTIKDLLQDKFENLSTNFSKIKIKSRNNDENISPTTVTYTQCDMKERGFTSSSNLHDKKLQRKAIKPDLKFFSNGLPSQKESYTPVIYRRAISLRGHSKNRNSNKGSNNGNSISRFSEGSAIIRRSHSDQSPLKKIGTNLQNEFKIDALRDTARYEYIPEDNPEFNENQNDVKEMNCDRDSFIQDSEDQLSIHKITDLLDRSLSHNIYKRQTSETLTNSLYFLNQNMEEFLLSLNELDLLHAKMKVITPDRIRQYFDLPSKLIQNIFRFQREINIAIKQTEGNIILLSKVFLDENFRLYQQYMIASPYIYENVCLFKRYFDDHLKIYKSLMLLPSTRLNFYTQILNNLLKFCCSAEKSVLHKARDYLENLKQDANTEMTINIIKKSPIDLHLVGNIIYAGHLSCSRGPLLKRSYYVIAFEEILLFTITKVAYCIYIAHYRHDQILNFHTRKNNTELILETSSYNQESIHTHCFEGVYQKNLADWAAKVFDPWLTTSNICNNYGLKFFTLDSFYDTEENFPLSLVDVFPSLKQIDSTGETLNSEDSIDWKDLSTELLQQEKDYIRSLNSYFNPETLPPPSEIKDTLIKLLNIHEGHFFPEILNVSNDLNSQPMVNVFMNYLDKFSIYKDYIILRALCTAYMPDGMNALYYISPIQHFMFLFEWSKKLGRDNRHREASRYAIETLSAYLKEAKTMLLRNVIQNCILDFDKAGDIKKKDQVFLRTSYKSICFQSNTYTVVLFKNVILILKPTAQYYKLIYELWLYQINIGPPCENTSAFKLEQRQGGNNLPITFEFRTEDARAKCSWVECISRELISQAEQIKKCSLAKNIDFD